MLRLVMEKQVNGKPVRVQVSGIDEFGLSLSVIIHRAAGYQISDLPYNAYAIRRCNAKGVCL